MKTYDILKDFTGSQTGNDGPFQFTAGTQAELSNHLAEVAVKEKWATLAEPKKVEKPAAPVESRETKIEAPEETKPEKPAVKKAALKKGKK